MKKIISIILLLVFLLTGCTQSMGGLSGIEQQILDKPDLVLKVSKDKIFEDTEIIIKECNSPIASSTPNICVNKHIVKYKYVSDKEVQQKSITIDKKIIQEDLSKRTKNSQHFKIDKNKYQGKFFVESSFYKDNDKWFQIETATTTLDAWNEQAKTTFSDKIKQYFGKPVFALDFPVAAGDGMTENRDGGNNWDTIHDQTSASQSVDYTGTDLYFGYTGKTGVGAYYITRFFSPVDTNALPDGAIISAADFKFYVNSVQNGDNDAQGYITLVQTFQASPTELVAGDYEDCGSDNGSAARAKYTPVEGIDSGNRITLSTASTGWNTFPLNSTGIDWIDDIGYTLLGVREGHDVENVAYAGSNGTLNGLNARTSEYADTEFDPYLSITYTAAPAIAPANPDVIILGGTIIN